MLTTVRLLGDELKEIRDHIIVIHWRGRHDGGGGVTTPSNSTGRPCLVSTANTRSTTRHRRTTQQVLIVVMQPLVKKEENRGRLVPGWQTHTPEEGDLPWARETQQDITGQFPHRMATLSRVVRDLSRAGSVCPVSGFDGTQLETAEK